MTPAQSEAHRQHLEEQKTMAEKAKNVQEIQLQKYEAVPSIEMGEYGHGKHPEMMKKLRTEEALAHLKRAKREWNEAKKPLIKL